MSNFHSPLPRIIRARFQYGLPQEDTDFARWVDEQKFEAKKTRADHPAKFSITDLSAIYIYTHSPIHLANLLENYLGKLSKSNLHPLEKEAIEEYHATTKVFASRKKDLEDDVLLVEYFQISDELLFSGTLRSLCHLSFVREQDFDLLGQANYPVASGDFAVHIKIRDLFLFPTRVDRVKSVKERLDEYRHTLLHEMTHAFFKIYSCQYVKCRDRFWSHKGVGRRGHGKSWLRATLQLERATEVHFGVRYDLNRSFSASSETAFEPNFLIENGERLELATREIQPEE